MRGAFTLVEVMIAVALGAVVAGMMFAGLRLASSSVSTADRLATQNQLITAAMLRLSDELDSWSEYDDGTDPQATTLDGVGRGKPFCRLSAVWSANHIVHPWGDDPMRWSSAEPASWWRGCMAERFAGFSATPRFGYYGISGASVPATVTPNYPAYGTPPQPTADSGEWLFDQQRGLCMALGFYGMADYLPANAIMGWYGDNAQSAGANPGWPTQSGFAAWFMAYVDYDGQRYNRAAAASPTPQSVYQATYNGIFSILSPKARQPAPDLATAIDRNRYAWVTWEDWHGATTSLAADVADLFARNEAVVDLMPLAPSHWPRVDARILRTLHKAYFTNLCTIGWISPITGERSELRFTGFGTTLRGARIQRGLDAP